MNGKIIKVDISKLKHHPENGKIYGADEDITALKEHIRKSGIVTTLTISSDYVVLSGNRRLEVCKQLVKEGYDRFSIVDCEVRDFKNEEDELEYIVISNDSREKTIEQKAREAQTLIEVEKQRAEKRRLATLKQNITDVAEPPHRENTGKTRDIVAKKLKMKSGREVERAVKSVETIDKLTETGRKDDAELIRDTLNNTSASTAADLSSHIDELTEDEKQAIRDRKMSAYKVVSKYATKRVPKITSEMSEEEQAEIARKQACKEAVEEYIAQSMGLIDTSNLPVKDNTDDLISFFNSSVNTFTAAISNLIGKAPNFSEEQFNRVFGIIKIADDKIYSLSQTVGKQLITLNNDGSNISNDKLKVATLEERAKRLKDDSEAELTYTMITSMFKAQTNNYLEALDDYTGMVETVTDSKAGIYELLNQFTVAKCAISQQIDSFKKAVIKTK